MQKYKQMEKNYKKNILKESSSTIAQYGKIMPSINNLTDFNTKTMFEFNNNKITINLSDCITFLKSINTNSVDLIVTDPAYSGMNNHLKLGKGRIIGKYKDKGNEQGKWFREFQDTEENYNMFLQECKRILNKKTGHIYIMFDSYSLLNLGHLIRNFFNIKNIITWDKVNLGMGHYFRRRHEYIIFSTNDNNRHIRNRKFPDVWRFKRIHSAKYPTQKPVELFQTMIYASAEPNFIICDPFLGSGSAAIAAVKNKCNFLGCDISTKAYNLAVSRVEHFLKTGTDNLQKNPSNIEGEKIFWE